MKRIFIGLLFITMTLSLFSCKHEANKEYRVYELGGYDYISGALHSSEMSFEEKVFNDNQIDKNKNISIENKNYDLKYSESTTDTKIGLTLDYYQTSNGDAEFAFNRETGKIESYFYRDNNYLDNITGEKKTKESCLEIAKDFLRKNIDNIDEYVLSKEEFMDVPRFDGVYKFTFVRIVNNIKINDSAQINVSSYGDIVTYKIGYLGKTGNVQVPDDEELAKIQELVDDKMTRIYSNVQDKYDISYETEDIYFITLADGTDSLEYKIEVTLANINDSTYTFREITSLLVVLD
ncbi:MAG: hypothetical protein IKJ75_01385 [Clostridia bacterium]|nr:hypothetical protein [Clostridia bacterium]